MAARMEAGNLLSARPAAPFGSFLRAAISKKCERYGLKKDISLSAAN